MSLKTEREPWIDRWWPPVVILYAAVLAGILAATAGRVQ